MPEEMDNELKKELEEILAKRDYPEGRMPPCRYYCHVPPPGCILGWDISQCNLCSFYQPIESPEERADGGG